jgi:hypothetical protein
MHVQLTIEGAWEQRMQALMVRLSTDDPAEVLRRSLSLCDTISRHLEHDDAVVRLEHPALKRWNGSVLEPTFLLTGEGGLPPTLGLSPPE